MKRASVAALCVVAGCGGGGAAVGGASDASSDGLLLSVDAAEDDGEVDAEIDASVGRATDAASNDSAASPDVAEASSDACAEAGVPASTLECTGLYADFATKAIAPGALPYTPASPLWSDGAQKQRWMMLPPNTQIDISNPNEWVFPVGTKVFKEFRVNGQRVETRMFQKTTTNFWVYATYAWNSDASATTINYGGPVPVGDSGATWNIPTNDDCNECHRGRQDRILGFEQVGLGLPTAQGLTLAQLAEMGLVTPPPANVSLSIGDDGTGLDALALGWIHVNCGVTCHNSNPSAAGYGAGMRLRLDATQLDGSPPNPSTWDVLSTTVNVPCVSGSLAGQPRIVPQDAADSVIYQLINERGALQMPPIASQVVDSADVAVVAAWIDSMTTDGGTAPTDGGVFDGGLHHIRDAGVVDAAGADSGPTEAGDGGTTEQGDATEEAAASATGEGGGGDATVTGDAGDD